MLKQDSFPFPYGIDTDHLYEDTLRKPEALKMSRPGLSWYFLMRASELIATHLCFVSFQKSAEYYFSKYVKL